MGRVMPREIRHPHRGESEYRPHERGRAMGVVRRIGLLIVATGLVAAGLVAAGESVAVAAPTASARGPVVTPLAEVGSDDFVIGSTIGPDRALYVTDGVAGAVLRIDRRSGHVTT